MYYYGARYYDPRLSIFISVDPLAEEFVGWTPYHYVHNNPINMIDPTGMSAEWIPNGDGTYTAEKGDSAATLAKDAGISYEQANTLVQNQLGSNYIDTDGVEKSNVEIGDKVVIPEQHANHQRKQKEIATIDKYISDIDKNIAKLTYNNKVQEFNIKEFENQKNEIAKLIKESRSNAMGDKTSGGGTGGVAAGALMSQQIHNKIIKAKREVNQNNSKINSLNQSKMKLQQQRDILAPYKAGVKLRN